MRASPHGIRNLSGNAQVVSGNAGDHPLIATLLTQVALAARTEDFQSRNDAPSYSPADRLLVKCHGQLIGHVHLARSMGWFRGERCPLVNLNDFVVLPEYHRKTVDGADYAASLLQVAELTAANEGAILAVQHTDQPEWFQQHGWSCFRAQGHTRANTRAILSHLNAQQCLRRQRSESKQPAVEIRSWRHVELDCLRRIYQQSVTHMWGALHRSDDTWQWLVGRKAHDQILLAIDRSGRTSKPVSQHEPTSLALDSPAADAMKTKTMDSEQDPFHRMTSICKPQDAIGYAILRGSCIVEMFTLPGFSSARVSMIARACHDAIDRDHHFVELHTPVIDPMHELLVTAGGSWLRSVHSDGTWMFKLLAPNQWMEQIYPVLQQRVREEGLACPLKIAMDVGTQTHQLTLSQRSVRLQSELPSSGEPYPRQVASDWLAFQDLLTSNLIVSTAIATGQLETDTPETSHALATLFPFQLFWQSPLEILRL